MVFKEQEAWSKSGPSMWARPSCIDSELFECVLVPFTCTSFSPPPSSIHISVSIMSSVHMHPDVVNMVSEGFLTLRCAETKGDELPFKTQELSLIFFGISHEKQVIMLLAEKDLCRTAQTFSTTVVLSFLTLESRLLLMWVYVCVCVCVCVCLFDMWWCGCA